MSIQTTWVESLRSAAKIIRSLMAAPAATLWTDADRIWESDIPDLASQVPKVFVLGTYVPDKRLGPSIWLRCAVAGKLGHRY
jgi:hypothetical protein